MRYKKTLLHNQQLIDALDVKVASKVLQSDFLIESKK